jgi:uncharacterized membrane protein YkvA (DUF1232 family)
MARKLKDWARAIKRDVHAIYLAARDPRVPWYAKALALCVAGYALSPIDLIPDFVPVIGYLDDLVIVPLGILAVVKLIPPDIMAEHRATAATTSERPISRVAAVVIVLLWIGSMALVGWLIYRHFVGRSQHDYRHRDVPQHVGHEDTEWPLWVISGRTDKSAPCPLYPMQ